MRHAACLPARMGGGGKTGIDALARASGHSPPHGGVYFRFREREGKALGVPAHTGTEAISRPSPQRGQQRHPRSGVTQTGGVAASEARTRLLAQRDSAASPQRKRARRPTGKERGESAMRVSQRTPRPRERVSSGKERDLNPSRTSSHAPDRHPDGPGLQARSAPADRAGRPLGQRQN
jgi:hypothetical protein